MTILDAVFLLSLILGGSYMVATLIMGGLQQIGADLVHGVDGGAHDVGAFGHDAGTIGAADIGGAHDPGAGALDHGMGMDAGAAADSPGVDAGHHHTSLMAFINPMFVASFFFGFGGVGYLSRLMGLGAGASLGAAAVSGLAIWWSAALLVLHMFGRNQATSHVRQSELAGARGTVTAPIEGKKPGMVSCVSAGTRQTFRAVTEDDESIPTGARVRIRKVENNTALVVRIDK